MSVVIINCSRKRFKAQNDLRDWEVDSKGKPVKLVDEDAWVKKGVSIDPADIPKTKIEVKPEEALDEIIKKETEKAKEEKVK